MYKQRHMELGGKKVISHFTFTPPLTAASNLEGQGCFIFPINTEGKVYRQDGRTEVKSDQGVLMKCGAYVNKWENLDDTKAAEVIILRLYPEVIAANLDKKTLAGIRNRMTHRKTTAVVPMDDLMLKYLESLFFYFDNPSLIDDDLVNLKLAELLLLLVGIKEPNPAIEILQSLFEDQRYTLKEVLEANLFENLSLRELACLVGMSETTFRRKCKELLGRSPGAYIKGRRMEAAEQLLKHTKKPIASIAYELGFNDPDYFSRYFRSHFGSSPKEFRWSS